MYYNHSFEKNQIHIMLSEFFVIKMVIKNILFVFFSERGAVKKKLQISLSHPSFEIFILKVHVRVSSYTQF